MFDWFTAFKDTLPETLIIGDVTLPLIVRRYPQARRMTLRYDAQRRVVRLSLPPRAPSRLAAAFLREKQEWLARQMERHPARVLFENDCIIPVLGTTVTLRHTVSLRGRVERKNDALHISASAEHLAKRVETWLKAQLRAAILSEAAHMADRLGVKFRRVSVRDTSSRWGSCSREGNLSFCWRLVFAPRAVLSYLIAHEVAHLREMNHSEAFWREVEKIYPDYRDAREWLKNNASELRRYG